MSEAQVEQQQEPQAPVDVSPFEDEARAQGWVSKDEFRGDDSDWVDAETFVKRGKEIMPILRKNNEKLLKELADAKKAAEEAREAAREFKQYQKELTERKVSELKLQIEQLKQAKKDAISSGDGDRVIAIDDAIDDLKEQQQSVKIEADKKAKEAAVPAEPEFDDNLKGWLAKNDWFGRDTRMTSIANGLGEDIRREKPHLVGVEFLEQLDKELAEYFPEKFGKAKRQNPIEGGGSGGRPTGGRKSYDNLPADAKAACDKFVKQGLMTREEYLSSYDWE